MEPAVVAERRAAGWVYRHPFSGRRRGRTRVRRVEGGRSGDEHGAGGAALDAGVRDAGLPRPRERALEPGALDRRGARGRRVVRRRRSARAGPRGVERESGRGRHDEHDGGCRHGAAGAARRIDSAWRPGDQCAIAVRQAGILDAQRVGRGRRRGALGGRAWQRSRAPQRTRALGRWA